MMTVEQQATNFDERPVIIICLISLAYVRHVEKIIEKFIALKCSSFNNQPPHPAFLPC
jgi:hypothetical protein